MSDIEKNMAEIGNEIFRGYGVDNLTASILSTLYFEPEEMSMEELATKTGYSLASISLKIRTIENNWGIQRIKKPGSRKVYFYMEKDLLDLYVEQMKKGYEHELKVANKKVLPLIEEYRKEAVADEQTKRLQLFETYYKSLNDFSKIVDHVIEKIDEIKTKQTKNFDEN